MTGAPHAGRKFRNLEPATPIPGSVYRGLLREMAGRRGAGKPAGTIPVEAPQLPAAAQALAVTWLGHATALIEVDGYRVLADPIVSDRCSPVQFTGPRRLHRPPLALSVLPSIDAIVISHDHYDHLDHATVAALMTITDAVFYVPLGIGAIVRGWGVPAERVAELDWFQARRVGDLIVTCTPARHFSGRGLARNGTLWASWSITGPEHRVFFGGDTGYTRQFGEIGDRLGPFDLTVLPIGAYDIAWPDIHMTPEQAAAAHRDLGGGWMLPIHWATFDLARHGWAEPIERLMTTGLEGVLTPPPGRRLTLNPGAPEAATERWWRGPS